MKSVNIVTRSISFLLFFWIIFDFSLQAQVETSEFVPRVGQDGKDVIWVPTPDELVDKMLEMAGVTADDIVVDLGSGDGKTVIAAAKLGATAIGVEFNPDMVDLSNRNAKEAGVSRRAKFINTDLFEYDLSEATVVTMFLLPDINLKLRPRLLDLKPGTRIVSNTFTMGQWEPDLEVTTENNWNSWNSALLWIVPAKVGGTWKMPNGELTIRQQYQMIYGTFKSGNTTSTISEGRLDGDKITFRIDGELYNGQVKENKSIVGTATSNSGNSNWIATLMTE